MFTTPEDWALVAREMLSKTPDAREEFADFDRLVAQELADKNSWNDLESFYQEAAGSTLSRTEFQKLQTWTTDDFEAGALSMLEEAITRANQDKHIKAVYCKYGVDDAKGNLTAHLCTTFSAENDAWASQCEGMKGAISGPKVSDIFVQTGNARSGALASNVRNAYINARLLAAWGRAADKLQPGLPLGFARHDFPVVKRMPGKR